MPSPMLDARDTVGTKADKPEFKLLRGRGRVGRSWQGKSHAKALRQQGASCCGGTQGPCVVGAEKEKGPGWRVGEPW